ncbi:MAG: hypothetical protein SGI83_17995 [Bacteroidota bacterium]|nr:hypothetical protein [Bacteroidota bacterium]
MFILFIYPSTLCPSGTYQLKGKQQELQLYAAYLSVNKDAVAV